MMFKKAIPLAMICVLIAAGSAFGASPAARHKMSGDLSGLIAKKAGAVNKKDAFAGSEKRKVIFYARDTLAALKYISSNGCGVLKRKKNLIIANVSLDKVEDIVSNGNSIAYARLPRKFFPCEIISEGVNVTGASTLRNSAITGKGVKIAVLDVGFKGLTAAIAGGEISSGVKSHDFTGNGLETQYKHGTACAEIIHDMVPDAELHLLKVGDEIDFYDAAAYCVNNGIDIVSASIGTFGTGPGDGTGSTDEICDDLKMNGILVVAAAGNEGNYQDSGYTLGTHWQGPFTGGGNGDSNTHQFIPGDSGSWYNVVAAAPYRDDDGVSQTDDLAIAMRWDDWPGANVDYDMYLYDFESGALAGSSTDTQSGSQPPIEGISIDVPDTVEYKIYKLVIKKKNGQPAGKDIEIMLGGASRFYPFGAYSSPIATSSSSILEPADAGSVLAVGAINQSNWATGPQEDFSSQGPTNAWAGSSARIKPDICGPDRTSGSIYGATGFPGTSAATPHVAGAAALILSMHPQYTVDQLRAAIEQSAIDMGSIGKDNIYGNGRLRADKSLNTPPVLDWAGEAGYVNDGLEPETGDGLTPFTFKVKYTDTDGDAPTIRDLYIDRDGDGDYADAGEVISMTAAGSDYKSGVIYTFVTNIPYSSGSSNCSYYFQFSDGADYAVGNITSAINSNTPINKPDIFSIVQEASISVTGGPVDFGAMKIGDSSVSTSAVIVKNNGSGGSQTYSLSLINPSGWTAVTTAPGVDQYRLSSAFDAVGTVAWNPANHALTTSPQASTAVKFAGSETGTAVPFNADRHLYLKLETPSAASSEGSKTMQIVITASVD